MLGAAYIRKTYKANTEVQDYIVAVYALAASAFISIGLAIELPHQYFPIALAAQTAATAWSINPQG